MCFMNEEAPHTRLVEHVVPQPVGAEHKHIAGLRCERVCFRVLLRRVAPHALHPLRRDLVREVEGVLLRFGAEHALAAAYRHHRGVADVGDRNRAAARQQHNQRGGRAEQRHLLRGAHQDSLGIRLRHRRPLARGRRRRQLRRRGHQRPAEQPRVHAALRPAADAVSDAHGTPVGAHEARVLPTGGRFHGVWEVRHSADQPQAGRSRGVGRRRGCVGLCETARGTEP